jgi:hypothetical protein
MLPKISPLYQINLQKSLFEALFIQFYDHKEVERYIRKWYETDDFNFSNFKFIYDGVYIDFLETLNTMDGELLLQIAVDLGVDTPDFIPSVATFKNEIKSSYATAFQTFEKALKEVYEHPDISIGLVNSALESILKELGKDERLKELFESKGTLYTLSQNLLKSIDLFPKDEVPVEIRNIGSGLLNIMKNIEDLRSTKTKLHGLSSQDYMVTDTLLAQFVVNAASTVGIFLINYYKKRFPPQNNTVNDWTTDLPF